VASLPASSAESALPRDDIVAALKRIRDSGDKEQGSKQQEVVEALERIFSSRDEEQESKQEKVVGIAW
jgi:hypothetical protein